MCTTQPGSCGIRPLNRSSFATPVREHAQGEIAFGKSLAGVKNDAAFNR